MKFVKKILIKINKTFDKMLLILYNNTSGIFYVIKNPACDCFQTIKKRLAFVKKWNINGNICKICVTWCNLHEKKEEILYIFTRKLLKFNKK